MAKPATKGVPQRRQTLRKPEVKSKNNRAILGIDAFIVSHLAAVKSRKDIADTYFIYYWLYLTDMVNYMENPGYPSLKLSTILKIAIPLPSIEDQRRISAKLQELMQEVERARTACEKQLYRLT